VPAENPPKRVTVPDLARLRAAGQPIVAITAYTAPEARCCDAAGVDMVLVGDSLGRVVLGLADELGVSMEDMERHTAAVARGLRRALLVADLPFLSYQADVAEAVRNAGRLVRAGAAAVKLEGGAPMAAAVERIVAAGIPVVGHLGFTPQSVRRFGGARVQGRGRGEAERLLADANALVAAGISALVLEMIPADVARAVTESLPVPTIGIGAGPACSGQILVLHDVLGLSPRVPRLARVYADLAQAMERAVAAYAEDVRRRGFPGPAQTHDGQRWGGDGPGGTAPGEET
jgi:3-methyl-2-oxobutanoate hydroxymethyltransferase